MKLNVTFQGGDKDGTSDLRETPDFPIELPGGSYVLTFRHALREAGLTEARATWVPQEDPQN
jgi:hypothetical protein